MQRNCLLILLIIAVLITGCQPAAAVPTTITSNDIVGQISLQFPEGWSPVRGIGNIDGRLNVTLVRSPNPEAEDLSPYPLLQIAYDNRQMTVLALNTPLDEYALRVAEQIAPGVTFNPPETIQMGERPAVQLEGTDIDGRGYVLTLIDYVGENAVVSMLLEQPGQISDRDQSIVSDIAETITISINQPVSPTTLPEATSEIPPESTSEAIPSTLASESTAEVIPTEEAAPGDLPPSTEEVDRSASATEGTFATQETEPDPTEETTPEVAPESTAETAPTEEASVTEETSATEEADADEAADTDTPPRAVETAEVAATEETVADEAADADETAATAETTPLPERTAEPTPDVTQTAVAQATNIAARTVRLSRNLAVVAPEGWTAVSNNQTYVVFTLGDEIADAVLREAPVPTGQAMIVIDLGAAAELFPPGSPADLPGRLKYRVENLTEYIDPVTFGEIRTTTINNKNAAETLITSALDDQFVILVDAGSNIFIQIKLVTANGEIDDFSPIAYEVAQSIVPK